MTASELASALHARRTGKGKWVALCPAHGDHTPSLHIAEGRKRPIVLRCMSQGCSTKAILEAIGLSWEAVMGDSRVSFNPAESRRWRRETIFHDWVKSEWSPKLKQALTIPSPDCAETAYGHWPELSSKNASFARNLISEYWRRRSMAYPDEAKIRQQRDGVHRAILKHGWDAIWAKYLSTERGKMAVQQYGIDPPQGGTT